MSTRETSKTASDVRLITARMIRHAFLSGIVAARNVPGHEPIDGPQLFVDYEPQDIEIERFELLLNSVT